ncbi:hypothetical protein D3C81_1061740 [compost metagenome]
MVAWREQHFAGTFFQAVLNELGHRPVIVFTRADDELDLIVAGQQFDVLVTVAVHFFRAWGLEVDDAADPGIDPGNIQGTTGLQRNVVTGVTQLLEQRDSVGLGQRFATGYADITRLEASDLFEDRIKGADTAAAERVLAVAVLATQRAAGEANEYRGQPSGTRFTLQRVKNFGDT